MIVLLYEKLTDKKLCCVSCNEYVLFEIIEDIECDWGNHDVIQCPSCEELFSIDMRCNAFRDLTDLVICNNDLLNETEKQKYLEISHLNSPY